MIEVKRGGDDSNRLFGNTIALCGVHLMPENMWLLTGWQREGRREFFTVGKWPVTWGADDFGISDVEEVSARCVDGVWVKSADTDSTVFGCTLCTVKERTVAPQCACSTYKSRTSATSAT